MKTKRFMGLVLILALMLATFVGCSGDQKASTVEANWTINVEGIKDESISFTDVDAENVDLKEIKATMRKKDGSEKEQMWKGYGLKSVLEYLKVEEYSSVIVEAGDGYGKELTKDLITSEGTILGIMVDGKALGEDNKIQLVIDGKGSNWWVKDVVKIKVVK